jgi:hypothetical protein
VAAARIVGVHLAGDAETLAGGAADDDLCRAAVWERLPSDVPDMGAVTREQGVVGLDCRGVDVVRPNRRETGTCEADVESSRAGVEGDESGAVARPVGRLRYIRGGYGC